MNQFKRNIACLSARYTVRRLTKNDIDKIYKLCIGNPLYYEYCPPEVTKESIQKDMVALPPGISLSEKYYLGFFDKKNLIAVMDFIDGYPEKDVVYIGFFMTDVSVQKRGVGTDVIQHVCEAWKKMGFRAVQLAWVKGNPQAEHFWRKNGFQGKKETSSIVADCEICVISAEKML